MEYFLYSLRHGSLSAEDLGRFGFSCLKNMDTVDDMTRAFLGVGYSDILQ
jgi:hypothetical protein